MRFINLKLFVILVFGTLFQVECQLYKSTLYQFGNKYRQAKMQMESSSTVSTTSQDETSEEDESSDTDEYSGASFKTLSPNISETVTAVSTSRKSTTKFFSKLSALSTATTPVNTNLLPLPPGASAVLVKPTKYHYYPHNQHIYLLPECAIQQVCNAVYVRLNWTQPLCACPSRYRDPCSASLNSDDLHTTKLITGSTPENALTLVKTCEPTADMRLCRSPRDWSLLALQNIRTGKSHYLVICHCPEHTSILEGPMSHDQPTYASVPGIRVYGMMCVQGRQRSQPSRTEKSLFDRLSFPWHKVAELQRIAKWD